MVRRHAPEELLSFPCTYEFKAFGPAQGDDRFIEAVREAVATVVPVSRDAMKIRHSAAGHYQCVSLLVRLESGTQLQEIYAILRSVPGLRYLL